MKKKIFFLVLVLLLPMLSQAALININTATQQELESITGVGEVIAERIIEYRNLNGSFKTIEEVKNVKGIGDTTFLKMKNEITVGTGSFGDSSGGMVENSGLVNSPSNFSAHTGDVELGEYQKEDFKISAGRERLATMKTPIIFMAISNRRGENTTSFVWNFGDGTSAYGERVIHAYQFPGKYNVILNANLDQKDEATARTVVTVTEAKIKITSFDPDNNFIEITNQGDQEQNLNHWILTAGDRKYVFPLDTIISPKSSLKIPLKLIGLTNLNTEEVILSYPDGSWVSRINKRRQTLVQKEIINLRNDIVNLKNQQNDSLSRTSLPEASPRAEEGLEKDGKNVVVLKKELTWFERLRYAIFK